MNHSSVLAFHGSGPAIAPFFSERTTLMTVSRTPSGEDERPDRGDQVVELEVADVGVLVDAPRHAVQADRVLDQERDVEADAASARSEPCPAAR